MSLSGDDDEDQNSLRLIEWMSMLPLTGDRNRQKDVNSLEKVDILGF